jgi:hypothetical protein
VDTYDFKAYFIEKDLQLEEFSLISCFIANASPEVEIHNRGMLVTGHATCTSFARSWIGEIDSV